MTQISFDSIKVGDKVPSVEKQPITRTTLALFGGASGDHNPIHIDIDFARKSGMDDVFAHGMLSMAYLGQVLTNWVPESAIRSYGVRFGAITHLQDEIVCRAEVIEKFEEAGEKRIRLQLRAANKQGDVKLSGEAVVALA